MGELKAPFLSVYNFTRMVLKLMMNIFFRDIGIIGEKNIPDVSSLTVLTLIILGWSSDLLWKSQQPVYRWSPHLVILQKRY